MHVSASRIPLLFMHHAPTPRFMHHSCVAFTCYSCLALTHCSFVAFMSHSAVVHVSARIHLFMPCIMSPFSCISHSGRNLPDQVFFLGIYQDEHTASCSGDHYSCVALIYGSCVTFIHRQLSPDCPNTPINIYHRPHLSPYYLGVVGR